MDSNNNPAPKRRRARKPDGKFQGDNPATPGINEAWIPTDLAPALPKQSVMQKEKIAGISNDTAGKYAKKPKVNRPGIGKTTTKYN